MTEGILRKVIPFNKNIFENCVWNIGFGLEESVEITECTYSSMTNMTNITIKS